MTGKILRFQTYADGSPYRLARGKRSPRTRVDDLIAQNRAVVDLRREQLTPEAWLERIVREMRIRFYQPRSVKAYRVALTGLLRWFGGSPHELVREDLREYLELLVDGGASASWVSVNLSAARTAFDKMCGEAVTLGLLTPRRARRLPVVLAPPEVLRLLEGARSHRDKLLLGLMYATGLRLGEVVRLRWRDVDRERQTISVWQGKGRKDRQVMLPDSLADILRLHGQLASAADFVFPSPSEGRHLSPRRAQLIMARAVRLAGIGKRATCHSLRHSFATHLLENGVDVSFIQRLLGHAKLETTRLYTNVATVRPSRVSSPLDTLLSPPTPRRARADAPSSSSVGRMRLVLERYTENTRVTLWVVSVSPPVSFGGIVIKEPRSGWITMELPALEVWAEPLRRLPHAMRLRFEDPDFYEQLKTRLAERYLRRRST